MDKQTKTLLGLGAIAVALYFVFKPKGSKGQKTCAENEFLVQVQCDKAPCPTICTKGTYTGGITMVDDEAMPTKVNCADGTTDVRNGVVLPCQGHGGVLPTRQLEHIKIKNG